MEPTPALVAAVATARGSGAHQVLSATAVSPSLAPKDEAHSAALGRRVGFALGGRTTYELEDPAYVRNDLDAATTENARLMDVLTPWPRPSGRRWCSGSTSTTSATIAQARGRPRSGARCFPSSCRAGQSGGAPDLANDRAAHLGPPGGCVPRFAGTSRHARHLRRPRAGGTAESRLRGLGFGALRVRHYGDVARVELPLEDLGRALEKREEIVEAVRDAGYRYVTLDLEGLRSGNLSRAAAEAGEVVR